MASLPPEALDRLAHLSPESRSKVLYWVEEFCKAVESARETLSEEDFERFIRTTERDLKRRQLGITLPAEASQP